MIIRCDKCSTVYELDENLLPARGAPVQCSKCQFVFTAYPPSSEPAPASSEGRAEVRVNGAVEPAQGAASAVSATSATSASSATAANQPLVGGRARSAGSQSASPADEDVEATPSQLVPSATPGEPQFTADGRPIRKVPFPKDEPPPAAPQRPVAARPAGSLSGLSQQRALLWIGAIAVLVVLAIAFAAWRMLGHRSAPTPRREGQSRLLQEGTPGPRDALWNVKPPSGPDRWT